MHPNMFQRTSYVDQIQINTISFSSSLQIGDSSIINGFSRALAVQRETEIFIAMKETFLNTRCSLVQYPFTSSRTIFL